jgi:hypothetical protein
MAGTLRRPQTPSQSIPRTGLLTSDRARAALVGEPARPLPVCPHPVQFMVSTVELTEEELVRKGPTYTGGFVGGTIGSFIPSLWGAGQLSLSSVVFFMIGGFVGIWIAYRLFA